MKSKVERIGYRIGPNNNAIAQVFRKNKRREYGISKPLTHSTIGRITNLTYDRKFYTHAQLGRGGIAIYIRPQKDQS